MQGFTKKSNEVKTDWYESTARDVSLLAQRSKELAPPNAATCASLYL